MSLTALADEFESATRRIPVASMPRLDLPNGVFTITFPCGIWRTLRIFTDRSEKSIFRGKRLLWLLVGPDNSDFGDWERFGEITDETVEGFKVWKRWKGKKQDEYASLLVLMLQGEEIDGHSLEMSRRCYRCNRPLSTPESLAEGLGPECSKRERGGR